MKTKITILIFSLLFGLSTNLLANGKVYNDELEIEGQFKQEINDPEYKAYQEEFNKVKNLYDGFKAKKKILKNLKKIASKLGDEHQEFIEEKRDYEKEIDKFNNQIKCIQNPNAKDCRTPNSYPTKIQSIISRYYPNLNECFQISSKKGTNSANGSFEAQIKIQNNGRVKSIGWTKDTTINSNIFKCMNSIIAKISFPPTPNQNTVLVKQPFNFTILN